MQSDATIHVPRDHLRDADAESNLFARLGWIKQENSRNNNNNNSTSNLDDFSDLNEAEFDSHPNCQTSKELDKISLNEDENYVEFLGTDKRGSDQKDTKALPCNSVSDIDRFLIKHRGASCDETNEESSLKFSFETLQSDQSDPAPYQDGVRSAVFSTDSSTSMEFSKHNSLDDSGNNFLTVLNSNDDIYREFKRACNILHLLLLLFYYLFISDTSGKHKQHEARSIVKNKFYKKRIRINNGQQAWRRGNWKLCKSKQQVVVIDIKIRFIKAARCH